MTKKELKRDSDYRGFGPCGGKAVYQCVEAPAEGLRNYTHPKQGSAKDCSVIAALSSIQAVAAARISGAYPNYNFKSGTIKLDSKKIAVDSSGDKVFATSTGGSWPMLWEKAFAKLISNATCPRPSSCPESKTCTGEPDIATAFANGYSGLAAMKEIGRYKNEVVGSIPYDGSTGKLLNPSIGTTKNNITEDAFWKKDHNYSVLKYDIGTNKYLIRNPCGGEEKWVDKAEFTTGSPHFIVWGHVKD